MKKIFSALLAILMIAAVCAGCGSQSSTPVSESGSASASVSAGGKLQQVLDAGKLVVCTDPAWAPFEYIGADGQPAGSDIELANYLAEQLGVKLELVNVAFDSISTYLINDEADLALSAISITEERKQTLDFSLPYTTAQQYIIVPEDNGTIKTIEDLAGATIGVHLGTTGDFLVSDEVNLDTGTLYNTGASVNQYKFLTDAALALKSGELGAIVCDTLLAENLCAVNDGLKCFPLAYAAGEAELEQIAIAMKQGNPEFVAKINELLEPIIEDGTVDNWIVEHTEKASELA